MKSFLQKKSKKWLTLTGALIVFATFIVKEEWREHLKDLVSSIDAAESVFLIRTQNAETTRAVNNLRLAVGSKINAEKNAAKRNDNEQTKQNILSTAYTVSSIEVNLDTISRLSEKLPEEPKATDLFQSCRSQLSSIQKSNEHVKQLIVPELQAEERGIQLHADGSGNDALRASRDALASAAWLLDDTWVLERRLLKSAENRKQSDEQTYKWVTWASYALYLFGWTLGVIGSVYGVEGGKSD